MTQPRCALQNEHTQPIEKADRRKANLAKLVAWTASEIRRLPIGESRRFCSVGRRIEVSLLSRCACGRTVAHFLRVLGIFVLVCCAISHGVQAQSLPTSDPETPSLLLGKPAPPFTVTTLDGKEVSLSGYKGKTLIVNFWATWCGNCKVEMPWLAQLREKYASQGFEVLGIVTDNASVTKISALTQKYGVQYPILKCNHTTAQAYGGLPELPVSFFIDHRGIIVAQMDGADSEQQIEANIRKALGRR
jgi:cytochrome c biogenesis protein CcmG/thiol:disulfide interchange protein DsbE